MNTSFRLADLDLILLAGGLGTRLRGVLPPGTPKFLAPAAHGPFGRLLLRHLYQHGVRRVTLALGYGAERIALFLGRNDWPRDLLLTPVVEETPLGTGGALRHALEATTSAPLLAINGDTLAEVDLEQMVARHLACGARDTGATTRVADAARFGRVAVDEAGWVSGFHEKGAPGEGQINAGVYVIDRAFLATLLPNRPLSWEREVLPGLCGEGLLSFHGQGGFLDVGTPESLEELAQAPAATGRILAGGVA